MENIIKKAISAREINHKGQGLWVSMCILHGDLIQVCLTLFLVAREYLSILRYVTNKRTVKGLNIISKLGMNQIACAWLCNLDLCNLRYSLVEKFKK